MVSKGEEVAMSGRAVSEKVFCPSQISALARFFSAGVFRELGKSASSPLLARLLSDSGLSETLSADDTVRKAFDTAFAYLKKGHCRHEYIYKAALAHKVLLGTHSLNTASMLTETRVGSCKADVVILNGTSTVYEIKSERDKLSRLASQVSAYQSVFALTNVIVGQNHLEAARNMLPTQVGLLVLNNRFQISTVRAATEDLSKLETRAIFDVLRRFEAEKVVRDAGLIVPEVPNTKQYRAVGKVFQQLTPIQAHSGMVEVLQHTRSQKRLKTFIDELPDSLYAAALSTMLHPRDYRNVLISLDTSIEQAAAWA